ncbi:hypothetical protein [Pedobacter sp. MW01-1-1]|uniref:hypothetical protein n=1 Tax=Pedobacter sp. MW01-1-1 TaxID=3383027 RepID=UPI003FEF7185
MKTNKISPIMRCTLVLSLLLLFVLNAKSQSNKRFISGHYYNIKGEKVTGLIFLLPPANNIYFRKDEKAKKNKVNIDSISSVVTDNDSLVVRTFDNKEGRKRFCRLVATSPVRKIYVYYVVQNNRGASFMKVTGSGTATNLGWSNSAYSYSKFLACYAYQDGNTTYELKRSNYIKILTDAFTDFPELVERIKTKDIKYNEIGKAFILYENHRVI